MDVIVITILACPDYVAVSVKNVLRMFVLPTALRLSDNYAESFHADFYKNIFTRYTTRLLLFFAILCSFTEFYGHPIDCLIPEPFFMLGIREVRCMYSLIFLFFLLKHVLVSSFSFIIIS